jgi:S-adenosylmethionine synthetase
MFGYATDETPELLPMTILLAHNLNKEMARRRRDGSMAWLRPDSSIPLSAKSANLEKHKSLLNTVKIPLVISSL